MGSIEPPVRLASGHLLAQGAWPTNIDDPAAWIRLMVEGADLPEREYRRVLDLFDREGRWLANLTWDHPERPEFGAIRSVGPDGRLYTTVTDPFPQVRRYRVVIEEPESAPDAFEDTPAPTEILHLDTLAATSVASYRSEAVVVVGQDSDKPEYLFDRVRDGILTVDGLWIADGGSNEIRSYTSAGSFQFALGEPGEGPGEFRSLARIFLLEPDALLAFDAHGRVTVFGLERQVVRTFEVPWFRDGLQATEYARLGAREWWTFSRTAESFRAESPPDGPSALLATLGPNLVTSTSEGPEFRVCTTDAFDPALPSDMSSELEQGQQEALRQELLISSLNRTLLNQVHAVGGSFTVRHPLISLRPSSATIAACASAISAESP